MRERVNSHKISAKTAEPCICAVGRQSERAVNVASTFPKLICSGGEGNSVIAPLRAVVNARKL